MLPTVPGQTATVFVAFAITGFSPSQIKVGNVISVPPPATELISPATNAAPKAAAEWTRSSAGKLQLTSCGALRPSFRSERKPRDQRSVARNLCPGESGRNRVHEPETGSGIAVRRASLNRLGISRGRVAPISTVEHVGQLEPDIQASPLLKAPRASEIHIFARTPLCAVIAVIGGGISELPGRRIDPGCRVQCERFVRIIAVAVQIHRVERLSWHAVRECRLEYLAA